MLRQQLISHTWLSIEQEAVFPPARCAACVLHQQLISLRGPVHKNVQLISQLHFSISFVIHFLISPGSIESTNAISS